MKLSVALFFAGLFGALAVVFILLSFGTDYWLLASESCRPPSDNDRTAAERGDMPEQNVTSGVALYHEGFFWRCSFAGDVQEEDLLWALWFTNQPHSKVCMHSYLFPFPVSHHTHNATAYESAIIYRGFWSIFMLIGVAAVVLAGFFIICAAPFASHCLYKTGGGFFLASGFFLLCVVVILPLDPLLRPLVHVRSRRHLLLSAGRPPLPPDWPNRQDPLSLTLGNRKGNASKPEYVLQELMS
ncbi:transmembrane protein 182 isoform X2 [Phyllopteryx taeniolatus]|uniref:transmembrane protein 182 isoform X2 n=1 Tax=Phyllopteryx taeniolatus TaxID=161469 RepID=UPI002AD28725|nr:transmembrane protein 182 isoform X2 [Phyllopteryx taeniolatus]